MSSSTRDKVMRHLDLVGYLQPALHVPQHAPAPDQVDNEHFRAYTRSSHDVGGEYDVPIHYSEKQEEKWELNTFATCECLAWRGVWNAEERRRRQNVDVGQTIYLGLPYYGRWLMTAALIMVDKQYVRLTELIDKIEEVKQRHNKQGEGYLMSKPQYDREHHVKIATGVGDPQCFKGKAGQPKFKIGDRVRIKNLPDIFYTRCQMYTRGAEATVVRLVYESPPAEDEAWDNTENVEWFYSLVFKQQDLWPEYPAPFETDELETELSERWLEPA